ncbi:MAG: hypothetical protein EOM41_01265 [Bacilli bacterium]|nr:hypothetical protein [Bacilli bacterium]
MAIIKTVNPIDDSEMHIASGVVEVVKITKLETPDKFQNTHKASLKIGDDWVNVSAFKSNRDNLTYQEKDKTWTEVTKGCEVKFVVSAREWNGKTYYEVKKSGLKVTKKAPENASGEATSNSKPQSNTITQGSNKEAQTGSNSTKTTNGSAGSAKTFKVYGTIKSIEEGVAVVVGEDSKEVQVILGEHGSEVSIGGRLTAQVDGEGNIKSGFKSYGLPKSNQKDDLPIRLGNAISVANHFTDSYVDVVSIAKKVIGEVDVLRDKMASKYPALDLYSLGARVGQSVIIAAEKTKDINTFIRVAEELFIEICEAEQELREGKIVVEQKQETKQEVQEPSAVDDFSSDVDIPEDEFDEDQIPF